MILLVAAVALTPLFPGITFASEPPPWSEMKPGETHPGQSDEHRPDSPGQSNGPPWAQMEAGDSERPGQKGQRDDSPEPGDRAPWAQMGPGESELPGDGVPGASPHGESEMAPWALEEPVTDTEEQSPDRDHDRQDKAPPIIGPREIPREKMPESVPAPWVNEKPVGKRDNPGQGNRSSGNSGNPGQGSSSKGKIPSRLSSGIYGTSMLSFGRTNASSTHGDAEGSQRYTDGSSIVSDDFNSLELDPVWMFVNPLGSGSLDLNGTNANISVPSGSSHDIWTDGMHSPRLMQAASDTDFEIEVKFETLPVGTNAVQGLLIQADGQNFLRFDVNSSGDDTSVFAATFSDGSPSVRLNQKIDRGLPLKLRVTRTGDDWTLAYSIDGTNWTIANTISHAMTVTEVGVFVGNAGSQPPAHTGSIDYFFNTEHPIDPINADQSLNTSPPALSEIAFDVAATSLEVSWVTSKPATSLVRYGTTPEFEHGSETETAFRYFHSITLSGLSPLTTYQFQIESTGENGVTSTSSTLYARTDGEYSGSPIIDVWYGTEQSFGQLGNPQRWVNILGRVTSPEGVESLSYSFNGSPESPLSVGPNGDRLVSPGDFNIEIDRWELEPGANTVVITATDSLSNTSVQEVTVHYSTGNSWPSPYEVDWNTVSAINDAAQVIDGLWTLTEGGVRPLDIGYDRLIGLGEVTWDDFEIEVPITIHSFGTTYPPAVGLGARWAGHYPHDDEGGHPQPRWEWRPLGALGWYEWSSSLNCFRLNIHGDSTPLVEDTECRQLDVGTRYIFKVRVETIDSTYSSYSFKVWEDGQPEPSAWDLSALKSGQLRRGSALLVAQDMDATFGDVSIVPLSEPSDPGDPNNEPPPPSPIQSDDFNSGTELNDFWTFIDPVGDSSLKLDGINAKISVPAGIDHDVWTDGVRAPQLMQSVPNSDFEVAGKFVTQPQGTHAMQGLMAKADNFNFVRLDFYSSGSDLHVFAATFNNGSATVRANMSVPNGEELYLRINRVGSQWQLAYSHDGDEWTSVANFGYTVTISQVGVYVGNAGSNPPGYTGAVDYFFNTADPIDPYNVNPLPPPEPSTIQSDDFNSGTDLSEFWTFIDPVGDSDLSLDGLHANISVPAGSDHDVWINGNLAPRIMQPANDTDFEISTRFKSAPAGHHAMQGLIVEADEQNFIRLDFYSTGNNLNLFATTFSNGSPTVRNNIGLEPGLPLYLQITRERDHWTLAYSYDGGDWNTVAEFTYVLETTSVGVFAANAAPGLPGNTAQIDYFFNNAEPIDPVNANPLPPPEPSTLQSDDFNSGTELSEFWTFVDPVGDSMLTLDGLYANIEVPQGSDHDLWISGMRAPRLMQAANDTDFEIEARFATRPYGTHATNGLVVTDGSENFVRFDFYSSNENLNIFAGSIKNGTATAYANQGVSSGDLLYLRMGRQGDDWTLSFSYDGSDWTTAATFTLGLAISQAGVFVGNTAPGMPTYSGAIDYFFNNAEPIDPVNVNPPPPPPESTVESDDFTAGTLNDFWTYVDPIGDTTLGVHEEQVSISVPAGTAHDLWIAGNDAPRLLQAANDTDFEFAVKFDSIPEGTHAMQGLVIESDDGHLVRFDYYSAGTDLRIFAGTMAPSGVTAYANQAVDSGLPLHLRIRRIGDDWTLSYGYDGVNWIQAAQFTHAMTVSTAGLFVGNTDPGTPAYTGFADSFSSNPVW